MAERVGFEPTVPVTGHLISSQAPSTSRTPLRNTLIKFIRQTQNVFFCEKKPALLQRTLPAVCMR